MNDKKKKKEYVIPKVEIIDFSCEDIITSSAGTEGWGKDNNTEVWG